MALQYYKLCVVADSRPTLHKSLVYIHLHAQSRDGLQILGKSRTGRQGEADTFGEALRAGVGIRRGLQSKIC